MSFAFSRELRLCSAADFKQVFDKTELKVSSRQLLILARVNEHDNSRLGLVVAKKNIRTAVGRNRAKRHIRETFRLRQAELGNLDVVVLVRKGFGELEDTELNRLLAKQWKRLSQRRIEQQRSE